MLEFITNKYLSSVSTETPSTSGTICFWIFPAAATGSHSIYFKEDVFNIGIGNLTNNEIATWLYRKKTTGTSSTGLTINVLHHVACTWNNTGTNSIYIDGVLNVSETKTTGTATNTTIYVGSDSGTTSFLSAGLEDLREYNRILTLDEISSIYSHKGNDNIIQGLVHRWLMVNEKETGAAITGTGTVKDYADPSNNFTPVNSPLYSESRLILRRRTQCLI